jgi:hypothetical protein
MSVAWGIVGYRNFVDRARFDAEMEKLVAERGLPDKVVSGGATGADTMARDWATAKQIPFTEHAPTSPTAAAYKARNSKIVKDSTLIIAFISTKSRGTHDTINKAAKAEKGVVRIQID